MGQRRIVIVLLLLFAVLTRNVNGCKSFFGCCSKNEDTIQLTEHIFNAKLPDPCYFDSLDANVVRIILSYLDVKYWQIFFKFNKTITQKLKIFLPIMFHDELKLLKELTLDWNKKFYFGRDQHNSIFFLQPTTSEDMKPLMLERKILIEKICGVELLKKEFQSMNLVAHNQNNIGVSAEKDEPLSKEEIATIESKRSAEQDESLSEKEITALMSKKPAHEPFGDRDSETHPVNVIKKFVARYTSFYVTKEAVICSLNDFFFLNSYIEIIDCFEKYDKILTLKPRIMPTIFYRNNEKKWSDLTESGITWTMFLNGNNSMSVKSKNPETTEAFFDIPMPMIFLCTFNNEKTSFQKYFYIDQIVGFIITMKIGSTINEKNIDIIVQHENKTYKSKTHSNLGKKFQTEYDFYFSKLEMNSYDFSEFSLQNLEIYWPVTLWNHNQ